MLACTARVLTPRNRTEALAMRAENPAATLLAGGTDVMVYMEGGTLAPSQVINLWGCADLRGITNEGGFLRIGALTTYTDLVNHPLVPAVVKQASLTVGAVQIQNRGTVGGNICNGSPAGDTLPVWLALDAEFELQRVGGRRIVRAADYWLGYKKSLLANDELLTAVLLPDVSGTAHFRKVGTRMAQSISKVVFAGRRSDGEARIAFGAVGPVPMRLPAAEAALAAGAALDEVLSLVRVGVAPISDIRSTENYRRQVSVNVVRRWLES